METNDWSQLWAIAARSEMQPAATRIEGCETYPNAVVPAAVVCRQQRWGKLGVLPASVTSVVCEQCTVADLRPLKHHASLRQLSLVKTVLQQPDSLSALTQLRALSLNNSSLHTTVHLAPLENLESLDITGEFVSDISGVAALPRLERLTLGGGCLDDSIGRTLPKLTGLRYLSLSLAGQEVDFGFLAELTELRELAVRGRVRTVTFVDRMPKLEALTLTFHCIPQPALDALAVRRPGLDIEADLRSNACGRDSNAP